MKDEASRWFQTGHGQAPRLAEPHLVTDGELLQLRNNASGAASFGEVTRPYDTLEPVIAVPAAPAMAHLH
jgi:hypothetical protein